MLKMPPGRMAVEWNKQRCFANGSGNSFTNSSPYLGDAIRKYQLFFDDRSPLLARRVEILWYSEIWLSHHNTARSIWRTHCSAAF